MGQRESDREVERFIPQAGVISGAHNDADIKNQLKRTARPGGQQRPINELEIELAMGDTANQTKFKISADAVRFAQILKIEKKLAIVKVQTNKDPKLSPRSKKTPEPIFEIKTLDTTPCTYVDYMLATTGLTADELAAMVKELKIEPELIWDDYPITLLHILAYQQKKIEPANFDRAAKEFKMTDGEMRKMATAIGLNLKYIKTPPAKEELEKTEKSLGINIDEALKDFKELLEMANEAIAETQIVEDKPQVKPGVKTLKTPAAAKSPKPRKPKAAKPDPRTLLAHEFPDVEIIDKIMELRKLIGGDKAQDETMLGFAKNHLESFLLAMSIPGLPPQFFFAGQIGEQDFAAQRSRFIANTKNKAAVATIKEYGFLLSITYAAKHQAEWDNLVHFCDLPAAIRDKVHELIEAGRIPPSMIIDEDKRGNFEQLIHMIKKEDKLVKVILARKLPDGLLHDPALDEERRILKDFLPRRAYTVFVSGSFHNEVLYSRETRFASARNGLIEFADHEGLKLHPKFAAAYMELRVDQRQEIKTLAAEQPKFFAAILGKNVDLPSLAKFATKPISGTIGKDLWSQAVNYLPFINLPTGWNIADIFGTITLAYDIAQATGSRPEMVIDGYNENATISIKSKGVEIYSGAYNYNQIAQAVFKIQPAAKEAKSNRRVTDADLAMLPASAATGKAARHEQQAQRSRILQRGQVLESSAIVARATPNSSFTLNCRELTLSDKPLAVEYSSTNAFAQVSRNLISALYLRQR